MQKNKFAQKYPTLWEIFKFLVVGGAATVVDFAVMSGVLYLFAPSDYPTFISLFLGGAEPSAIAAVTGTAAGFVVGLVFNYVLSLAFVFTSSDNASVKTAKGFALFAALSAVGLAIHVVGMYLFNGVLGANEWIVKIVLTLVVLVFNYITRKFLIFNKKKEAN